MSQRISPCKGCGCSCHYCNDQVGLHLHAEIENLKQQLIERENHIVTMETNFLKEAEKFPNGEMAAISEELLTWQDKYSRLYEAHKRVQKVNQNLEDKLLRIVDKCETEKNALTSEVANLTRRLVDEKFNVSKLQEENERYRNDVNLAIQLLQCKPSNFVSQKYDSLPSDMQQKVRMYISAKRRQSDGNGNMTPKPEMKTIKVPIPTFPPTAMVYSVNKGPVEKDPSSEEKPHQAPVDIVSAAIMAKVLEEREKERAQTKHCETCSCPKVTCKQSKYTQTLIVESSPTCQKCSCPSVVPSKINKVSSALSIKGRTVVEKDKERISDNCDFSVSNNGSGDWPSTKIDNCKQNCSGGVTPLPSSNNNWDIDIDRLAISRIQKTAEKLANRANSDSIVTEGILVNIESNENSSVNSLTSDSSILSWQSNNKSSRTGDNTNSTDTTVADLISFDHKPVTKPIEDSKITGPRHCSVRMQVGTNNILLDNVVHPYTPVLYKSRNNTGADPLVHSPRSRSESSNSSSDEPVITTTRKSVLRTETEI